VPAPPPAPAGTAGTGRPPPGLLDLSLPWATLTCESASPGTLTRIGPVTALQARRLARAAAADQPPPRIREYVTARDLTCRYPFCGQPAWRGDLDHTRPWDKGGLTCSCNLGGARLL
jgi:hypothetical protein